MDLSLGRPSRIYLFLPLPPLLLDYHKSLYLFIFLRHNSKKWELGGRDTLAFFFFFKVSSTTPQHIKKQRRHFANKDACSQSYSFPSSHVWMWELDDKEGWALRNWCSPILVFKTLDCKEIKWINPKGNQSWILIGRTDAEAETPILWPPDVKNWLIEDPDARKDWRQEEKGTTEDEMVGWHYQLNGYEFEQTLGDSERQGSLACCSPWSRQESDTA